MSSCDDTPRRSVRVSVHDLLPRCGFPRAGTRVTCAVSGGADSLALLILATEAGCRATAVHVDHGLRVGSADEADLVRDVATRWGTGFRAEQVAVGAGPNLEARARLARRAVLPADAMTGHTADDQAETIVLNLLRGSGLDGVAAMRPDLRHPILSLRRAETRALCAGVGVVPFEDPSNADPRFRRNRVRHEVVPLLDDVAGRDVVPLLVRLADHAREVSEHLSVAAEALDPTDAAGLAVAPRALARLAVRSWLRTINDEHHPPDASTVERVLAVARLDTIATEVGGGWRVERSGGRLRLVPPG